MSSATLYTKLDTDYATQLHEFRKRLIEDLSSITLTQLKEGFPHEQILPKATYAPWRNDNAFMELYSKVRPYTLIDVYRLYELYLLTKSVEMLEGDILEVGVWKGGSSAVIGTANKTNTKSKLWLADTFKGVPQALSEFNTLYKGGEHADTSETEVVALMNSLGLQNFECLKGIFPAETSSNLSNLRFKLLHIDVDSYESASSVFEWAWPRMLAKGVVIFDDYGFWGCEGVTSFVNSLVNQDMSKLHNLNGHAVLIKHNK